MTLLSANPLLPYITLAILVAGLFVLRSRKIIAVLLAAQILFAYVSNLIDPVGLAAITSFWGICTLHWRNPSSKKWLNSLWFFLLLGIGIAFASHMIPGFHNLRVLSAVLISPIATPFTMYLNFDKVMAAVVLVASSGLLLRQIGPFRIKALTEAILISVLCVSLLIPLGILTGYVHFEPKFPDTFWLWAFNNLFFVCFAEEIIFRGFIQNYLMQYALRWRFSPFIPIVISSLLFALLLPGHLMGGPVLIAFATLSGVFYGYAYHRTHRLESAILVHFLVNLCHFLLFTYPMVAK